MESLLKGHPDERPPPLERPLDNVNLNINVLITTPDVRPCLLKGHFSHAKRVASQEGFHCIYIKASLKDKQHLKFPTVYVRYYFLFFNYHFVLSVICQSGTLGILFNGGLYY